MQVRQPTGPLPLLGHPDEGGSPIPDIYGTGNDTNGAPPRPPPTPSTEKHADQRRPCTLHTVAAAAITPAYGMRIQHIHTISRAAAALLSP